MTTEFDVAHLARLARLPLDARERAEFEREIPAILEHFADLPAGPPHAAPEREIETRADDAEAPSGVLRSAILSQAPRRERGFVKAPRGS
ncbi:MAG: Asp-tRNA(Asn)/Glu-tRNA(Gln) amidotransferase subunit GatC [Thermoplasmatota archaeon]